MGNILCGCGKKAATYSTGNPRVHSITKHPWCSACKNDYEAKNAGYKDHNDKLNQQAIQKGFFSTTHKKNLEADSYRCFKYYEPKCNNIDGHLGISCMTSHKIQKFTKKALNKHGKIRNKFKNHSKIEEMKVYLNNLTVDHIDGDPSNNCITNLQTLCSICHTKKTLINGDHLSDGRTKIPIKSQKIVRNKVAISTPKVKTKEYFTRYTKASAQEYRFASKKLFLKLKKLYPSAYQLANFLDTAGAKNQPYIYKKSTDSGEWFNISNYMKKRSSKRSGFRGETDLEYLSKTPRFKNHSKTRGAPTDEADNIEITITEGDW